MQNVPQTGVRPIKKSLPPKRSDIVRPGISLEAKPTQLSQDQVARRMMRATQILLAGYARLESQEAEQA